MEQMARLEHLTCQRNANTLLLFWGEKAHIEGYIIRIVHFL